MGDLRETLQGDSSKIVQQSQVEDRSRDIDFCVDLMKNQRARSQGSRETVRS
jgi:hypothetical protein